MMRIIAGKYRGRIIKMPKGVKIRPTQDRVREAIFNVIREKVPGSDVLDLYAGSGAFGIEALSRGAHMIIFVDNNTKCIRTIKNNISLIGGSAQCSQVIKLDGVKAIERFKKSSLKFDMIFMDPPYQKGSFDRLRTSSFDKLRTSFAKNSLIKIDACDILSQHGLIIAEHFIKDIMPENAGSIRLFKKKRYGDTLVSFYRNVK